MRDRIGRIYRDRAHEAAAVRAFQQALRVNPDDSVAHFSELDAAAGRTDRARKEYQAGLETNPENAEALAAPERLEAGRNHAK